MYNTISMMAITTLLGDMDLSNTKWKARLRKEWKESARYSRKKKKRIRKRLRVDWELACITAFDW